MCVFHVPWSWQDVMEDSSVFPLLLQVYVQVNREAECDESVRSAAAGFYRRLVQREDQAMALWTQFREITVLEYKRIYQVTSS